MKRRIIQFVKLENCIPSLNTKFLSIHHMADFKRIKDELEKNSKLMLNLGSGEK